MLGVREICAALYEWEFDALLLLYAVCDNRLTLQQAPPTISYRCYWTATVYMSSFTNVQTSNQVCESVVGKQDIMPWRFFDGTRWATIHSLMMEKEKQLTSERSKQKEAMEKEKKSDANGNGEGTNEDDDQPVLSWSLCSQLDFAELLVSVIDSAAHDRETLTQLASELQWIRAAAKEHLRDGTSFLKPPPSPKTAKRLKQESFVMSAPSPLLPQHSNNPFSALSETND
jgi:hypothetical protein